MARLIDADKIKLPKGFFEKVDNVPKFYEWLGTLPTVDAVEVIRCENCRWFGEEDEDGQCWCNFNDISTLKHSFCSHGERRKDEND